ncbi:MAG: flagellar type III secretion system pore protein FliP [Clostridiales bacterium]|nr:flagellar type III secretion system pore protein FliP [Clostridiales bacterium]
MKAKKTVRNKAILFFGILVFLISITFFCDATAYATVTEPDVSIDSNTTVDEPVVSSDPEEMNTPFELNISSNAGEAGVSGTLQILIAITVISLAPSILIMLTSFTRIIIVLHFVRTALGLQTTPPNQVIIGLALFLTLFIMSPVFSKVNTEAIKPFSKGEISQEEAYEKGIEPFREFMYSQTRKKDIKLFLNISNIDTENINNLDDIPTVVLIPSFIISELRTAFIIGFIIYIPFIIIDMVVASTLMSMGMMMLPPTTISMPFKILLFIMVDGWNLVVGELVKTFYTVS